MGILLFGFIIGFFVFWLVLDINYFSVIKQEFARINLLIERIEKKLQDKEGE